MSGPFPPPPHPEPELPPLASPPHPAPPPQWQRLDARMLLVHPVLELFRFLPVVVGVVAVGSRGDPSSGSCSVSASRSRSGCCGS